jgi:aspartyl-tRNA(Asn)/glutamyl-tRNA(Gln) amidotransferase subunit C
MLAERCGYESGPGGAIQSAPCAGESGLSSAGRIEQFDWLAAMARHLLLPPIPTKRPRTMGITRSDIEKVALLARLQLSDAELATMSEELAQIVGYVDQLAEVDTEGVEPMAHAIELQNVFEDDHVVASLSREQALANAPHHNSTGYLVPAVLGD